MWGKLAGVLFEKIIGGILEAWKATTQKADHIEMGADKVIKEQLKDEAKKAKRANKVKDDVRSSSDDDLDDGMQRPSKRGRGKK